MSPLGDIGVRTILNLTPLFGSQIAIGTVNQKLLSVAYQAPKNSLIFPMI
jgi:hypothetical protein